MSDHHRPLPGPPPTHGADQSAPHLEGTVREGTVREGTVREGTVREGTVSEGADPEGAARFRRTLARVMSMQVAALVALWWLQARYGN